MPDLVDDLRALDVFRHLSDDDRQTVASLCQERRVPAGTRLLARGQPNSSLFLLRSGLADVRLQRGPVRETLARLRPPAIVGEISFLTGRPCSADVDVVVDATIAEIPAEVLERVPDCRDRVVQGLALLLADRLGEANAVRRQHRTTPVVLLQLGATWSAPIAFPDLFVRALAKEAGGDVLWLTPAQEAAAASLRQRSERVWEGTLGPASDSGAVRDALAAALPDWTDRFRAIVIACHVSESSTGEAIRAFATHVGTLAGPKDAAPEYAGKSFLIRDANGIGLSKQTVHARLVRDAALAERAVAVGSAVPAAFAGVAESAARAVLGRSVGVVLGAGGARGWAHVGVLEVLARAGLPIDAIVGSSMGSIVAGLVAQGTVAADLRRVMAEWPRRRRRLRELRVWRMHLASERAIESLLVHFFGDRTVPTLDLPYATNAIDIERGEEVVIDDGLLRHATRASMAFPGWLPPVVLDGRAFIDAAIVNPVPVAICRDLGAHFIVAVNVLGPPQPQALPRRWPMREFEVMSRAFQLGGSSMGEVRGDGGDIVISPDLGDATMQSFDRYDELIGGGERAAEARVAAVLAAYEQHGGFLLPPPARGPSAP